MTAMTTVLFAVVGARFLIPLLIPRYPLPAIVAALVLDGIDQTIFQSFGFDPPGYQGYDKAMDVYYLAIAYLSTMRNWVSRPAVAVGRFLFFYRLLGVMAFELTEWRPLLLIFPNTFEYFFIAYELVRLRWDPARRRATSWITTAAGIWVCVKLPQEYWIHIAQLDVTDLVQQHPLRATALFASVVCLALITWFAVRPRMPAPDWPWRITADPLPHGMGTAARRSRWVAARGRLLSVATAEKVVLVGFLAVIYGQVLPGRQSTDTQLFLGVTVFVVVNAAVALWAARGAHTLESLLAAFGVRLLMNAGLLVLGGQLLRLGGGQLNRANTLFFILLLSLVTLLDDRYRPVYQARFPPERQRSA